MFFFSFNHSKYTIHNTKYRFLAQSLLEALLSITLGVILIGGSVGLIGVSLKTFNTAKQHLQANSLMRQTAEIIQSLARDNWHNISDLYPGVHYKLAKQGNAYAIQKGEEKIFDSQGLVSYWSFDEATSTIAYDNQSTNNGTLTCVGTSCSNPSWQTASNCVSGNCLGFTGTAGASGPGSYVQITNNNSLSYITLEAWIYPTQVSNDQMFLTNGSANANYFRILYSKPFISFYITGIGQKTLSGTTTLLNNNWYHLVATYDGNLIKLFVNGKQELNTLSQTGTLYFPTGIINIGIWATSDVRPFNGLIDEVRIYNRALSADEIKAHYLAGLDKLGLVSYWALDENGATTAYDSQSTNNGTLTCVGTSCSNPSWQTASNCVSGNCLGFTGTAGASGPGSYVQITNNNSLSYITLEAWVYPTQVSNDQMFLTNGSATANYFRILSSKPFISFYITGIGQKTLSGTTTLLNNNWYHLVATYDGNSIKLFVNGKQELNTLSQTGTLYFPTGIINIGIWTTSDVRPFNGLIDEVRIYNRALSAEEIAQRYQASYTKYFVTNKVSRTSGNIDTTIYNSANDDPSTLKINSVVKYGRGLVSQQTGGIADLRFYLTRSYNNQVFQQTDWSGGSGQTGPISNPGNKFDTADSNINYASTTGSIYMTTATTTVASLTSSILDTGVSGGAGFNSLLWQGSLGTGGTVKFQIAFSNSSSGPWTYYGPTSTSDYYQPNPNVSVAFPTTGSASPQNMRYIRYKVYLSTTGTTPKIDDIIINWSP